MATAKKDMLKKIGIALAAVASLSTTTAVLSANHSNLKENVKKVEVEVKKHCSEIEEVKIDTAVTQQQLKTIEEGMREMHKDIKSLLIRAGVQ